MRSRHRPAVALIAAVLATSACAFSGDGPTASPAPAAPTSAAPASSGASATSTASPSETGAGVALPDDLRTRPAVAAAIADTARRAEVDPREVVIAAWSPVTWNNGSLGCPKKGMSYTQALVDGELLLLRTSTELFQYNARAGGPFAFCASPSADYTVG